MELPDDVLSIVREYSRPVFKHYAEYNHALKVLGKKKWSKLKEKLHTESEVILPALHIYLEAFLKKQEVYQLRDKMKADAILDTGHYMHNRAFYAKRSEEDQFWLLVRLLYGDGKEYWEFREEMII